MPSPPSTPAALDGPRRRQAIRDSIVAQMMGVVLPTLLRQGGLTALVLLALAGDDSESIIGLAFLIMQGSMLARVFVAPRVDTVWVRRHLVRWIGIAAGGAALLVSGPMLGALGHPDWGVIAFLAALAACFIAMEIGVAAWFPLLHYIVPPPIRGRYFGSMRRAWQLTSFAAVFLGGVVLGSEPGYLQLLLVLVPAVLLQIGRVAFYMRLPDPPPASPGAIASWRDVATPLRDADYVRFVLFVLVLSMVQYAAVPFVVPFLRSELAFPASTTLYGTAAFGLGSAVTLTAWGRLADRRGTRLVFLLSGTIAALALGLVAATPPWAAGATAATTCAVGGLALAGAGAAGIALAYTVRLMRMAPTRHMAPYLNLSQAAIGLTAGLATVSVGWLLQHLPEHLAIASLEMSTFRLLFVVVALSLLTTLAVGLRRLPLHGEPRLGLRGPRR